MTDLSPKDQKDLMKQALKEWMDERYADVGRWAVRTLLVAAVTSFLIWYIQARGYKFP